MNHTFLSRRATLLASAFLLPPILAATQAQAQTYKDTKAPLEARLQDLMARLTPQEKMTLLSGTAFTTQPIARLGVPAMSMVDAGQGVRGGMDSTQGPATAFPSGVAMASSWNPELVSRVARAIGEEALNKGTGSQILLGPAVNIHRSPLGGRNGEYFSEDPFLAARLGVGYIQGMQSTGCGACIKHFAANNEEVDRNSVNVQVSERALREIYLPAFEAGVKEGHVWTVMSSYNRVNGPHASANKYLLTDVLKRGWGFDGMVMSDWGGVHAVAPVINAGNDLEMPGPGLLAPDRVAPALASGAITQQQIDENVRRTLRTVLRTGLLDGPRLPNPALVNSAGHAAVAQEAAEQGIILLKNQGNVLPLDSTRLRSIALIGPAARAMQLGAAGSPSVSALRSVGPLEGITRRAGARVKVNYAPGDSSGTPIPASALSLPGANGGAGLRGEYFANRNLEGQPALTRTDSSVQFNWSGAPGPAVPANNFSVRWTGRVTATATGRATFAMTADDGCRLFLDGKPIINHWENGGEATYTGTADVVAGQSYDLRAEYFQAGGDAIARLNWTLPGQDAFADAVQAARSSDVAVVFVTTQGTEGEGQDRPSMALPNNQDALIQAVSAANPKTIVVLNNGTPVNMTGWLARVPGLVEAWFPGQEGGTALARVLFGDVNPSGKLPDTLAARREDYPDTGNFPGVNDRVSYAEGIYVGYRHFDKRNIAPLFPFGHGLSYTTFRYSNLRLSSPTLPTVQPNGSVSVSVDITNTGRRAGAEVVQMYIHDPQPKIDKAPRELKGFAKIFLRAGETRRVTLPISGRALAYCDVPGKRWRADAGNYQVQIGASSRDIRGQVPVRLAGAWSEPIPFLDEQTAASAMRPGNLAAGRPVTASSLQNDPNTNTQAANAVDNDDDTRWASDFIDPSWLSVDLGQRTTIGRVRLVWEAAYATAYSIQVSTDGQAWRDVYSTESGAGDAEEVRFAPVEARYVRMLGRKRATKFGYSLWSFEVYAPAK